LIRDEYSPYKIVHHRDRLDLLRSSRQPNPLQLQLVPSNVCNQRCTFCAYRMKDYTSNELFDERVMMSKDKMIETIDCMVDMDIRAIHFTGGGEPTVHPSFKEVVRYAKNKGIEVALVSNGQLLDDELVELMSDSAWCRISVDSGSDKMYSLLRNVPAKIFHKVCRNIENLAKKATSCVVGVGFVVERENFREILEAAKLFKSIGVDNFRISAAMTPMGYEYFRNFKDEATDLANEAASLSDENFTVFNLLGDRIKDNFEGVQDYDKCPVKDLLAYVGADYGVYTCCTLAYNRHGFIGSIENKSFKEVWESETKRKMFERHNPSKHCQHPCMYKGRNEFINYCIKTNPRHTRFI